MAPQTSDSFNDGRNIHDRTFTFGCRIVNFCGRLYDRGGIARLMAPQLLRCGTSVPGMMEEAKAAESRRDFISKCAIALKAANESHVRLRMHVACEVGPLDEAKELCGEALEIKSIIGAIVSNTRRNGSGRR